VAAEAGAFIEMDAKPISGGLNLLERFLSRIELFLAPEKFFRDLRSGKEDREDQVAALQNVMTGELRDLEGFRVGEIQINIFVLGTDGSGKVVGLRTLSVET
jgi:hypothetical protein